MKFNAVITNKSLSKQIVGVAMRIKVMVKATFAAALVAMSVNHARAGSLNPSASDRLIGDFRSIPDALVTTDSALGAVEATVRDRTGSDPSPAIIIAAATVPDAEIATQRPLQSCGSIATAEVG